MAKAKPTVELEIGPDGVIRFEISGVSGKGCEELEAALIQALGGQVVAQERTPEYYQSAGLMGKLKAVLGKG